MSPHAYAILYLTVLSFALLLTIAGAIACWFSWYRDRRRRAREFLRDYERAIAHRPPAPVTRAQLERDRFGSLR